MLDIFLDPGVDSSGTRAEEHQQQATPHRPIQPRTRTSVTDDDEHEEQETNANNRDHLKDKGTGATIRDGVKNLVKSGIDNLKSVLPSHHRQESQDKDDLTDTKRKSSTGSIERPHSPPGSPSLIDKLRNRFRRPSSPSAIADQQTTKGQSSNYEPLWQASSSQQQGRIEAEHLSA